MNITRATGTRASEFVRSRGRKALVVEQTGLKVTASKRNCLLTGREMNLFNFR